VVLYPGLYSTQAYELSYDELMHPVLKYINREKSMTRLILLQKYFYNTYSVEICNYISINIIITRNRLLPINCYASLKF